MFCIIKAEKKIFNSTVKTIPDIWTRGKNSGKFLLCPLNLSKNAFENAVRNRFVPNSDWQKISCQLLESKFKTYELAKAAEASIIRNLLKKPVEHENAVEEEVAIPAKIPCEVAKGLLESENGAEAIEEACALTKELTMNEVIAENSTAVDNVTIVENSSIANQSSSNQKPVIAEQCGVVGNVVQPCVERHHIVQLDQELQNNFAFYHNKYRKRGAKDLATTMRIVSNQIIPDSLLKDFSFEGRRDKLPFYVYENVVTLIVKSSTDAFNNHNAKKKGFVPKTEEEVDTYFKDNFIKFAKQRSEQKSSRNFH